jgi:flagellar hook-basal body complex protein FliE
MDIKSIPPQMLVPKPIGEPVGTPLADLSNVGSTGDVGTSFADALKGAVEDANAKSVEAEHQVQRLVVGEGSVHEAMIAMQDASVAMEMVLAVRNKALEAYHEIMRMPV